MKLSELRPCDNCGKKIAPLFYVVRISQAMVMPAANRVLGLTQMFNNNLALAEVFSPDTDAAVVLFGEENPELMTELFLCMECAMSELNLMVLAEKRIKQRESQKEAK